MSRPKIPTSTETEVLTLSRRRCSLCFGLEADLSRKQGQIAHLDQRPENNNVDNLAFLCLDHHDQYDGRTRQSKGFQLREVKAYRELLYAAVERYLASKFSNLAGEPESALLAEGEFEYYMGEFQQRLTHGVDILRSISEVLGRYNTQTSERMARLQALLAKPRLDIRAADALDHLAGGQMSSSANELVKAGKPLAPVSEAMLRALARASAIASDVESARRQLFEEKLSELQAIRQQLETTIKSASECSKQIASYPRSSSTFNRGKRLFVGAIAENIRQMARCAAAFSASEAALEDILALF